MQKYQVRSMLNITPVLPKMPTHIMSD